MAAPFAAPLTLPPFAWGGGSSGLLLRSFFGPWIWWVGAGLADQLRIVASPSCSTRFRPSVLSISWMRTGRCFLLERMHPEGVVSHRSQETSAQRRCSLR